ncbi:hypothetical protein ACS0TY_005083 [Phlomoides rotata]
MEIIIRTHSDTVSGAARVELQWGLIDFLYLSEMLLNHFLLGFDPQFPCSHSKGITKEVILILYVLKPPIYDDNETADRVATPGVTVGLVWTSFGGEVQFVEATAMVGKGDLHLTGQLGNVIKESAQIALTWVSIVLSLVSPEPSTKLEQEQWNLNWLLLKDGNLLEGRDIHIHFPAGAVPKDGPSAGVTLVTSLVSLFSQRRVRADTAMTGEMTLRGLVLPVGGIKDKLLAAHRYGIKRVILPERNLKDLVEVPSAVLSNLEINHLHKGKEHVGPIPIIDGIGKEVATQITTNLDTNKTFYTDSNGRDFIKRICDYRSDWALELNKPAAGNYYPINLGIYVKDNEKELSVLVDRAMGGSSLVDGQIELMLHRFLKNSRRVV